MSFLGVFGHVVLDYILRVPRLPDPNTSIPVTNRARHFGGTGGNLARASARLGVETALASFVGEDFPDDYREALEAEGVDLTDLQALAGYSTPTAWIFTDREDKQVAMIDQGPMDHAAEFALPRHTVETSEWVHLGTGKPDHHERVLALAAEKGKRVAFDPSQEIHYRYKEQSFRRILERADLFFGNRAEVRRALGYLKAEDPEGILPITDTVIQTRGAQGSVIYTRRRAWTIPAIPPRKKVDITGAGDAYRAGFYAGLQRGLELPTCGLLGAAVASFSIEAEGPQNGLPRWSAAWERAAAYEDKVAVA